MKVLSSFIIALLVLGLWGCSDVGDSVSSGCTGGLEMDCAGECGGSAVVDECGDCGGSGFNSDLCCGESSSCVHYSTEIQPIFNSNCTGCHPSYGDLNLTSYSELMKGGNFGSAVISGDGAGSYLIKKLRGTGFGIQMPKNAAVLSETTINLIETWIDEGTLDN